LLNVILEVLRELVVREELSAEQNSSGINTSTGLTAVDSKPLTSSPKSFRINTYRK
jgi:hypothetical protein